MLIRFSIIFVLTLQVQIAKAQFTNEGIKFFQDLCVSERYYNNSIEIINRYNEYKNRVANLNLSSQLKWDYVREMIKKEDDESFLFRKNRDLKSPATSQAEMIKIKISDMSFDILRHGALIVFAENIDPLNVTRLNRRIVEECQKLVTKHILN